MNAHNGARYLKQALDSVYSQNFTNWEIVFWDNASTDNTQKILQNYDDKIKYFYFPQKISLGAARNQALQKCQAPYICFLDSDDYWLPEKLFHQVSIMKAMPEVNLLFTNVFYYFENTAKTKIAFKNPPLHQVTFGECLKKYPINLQTVMLKASVLNNLKAPWIDPSLELCEEADLFLRILMYKQGYYSHQPTAVYRIHNQMTSIQKRQQYAQECSYMLEKFKKRDSKGQYRKDFAYYEAKIAYWKARELININYSRAQEVLSPFKWQGIEFMILYITSFFGPFCWKILHKITKRGVYV